MSSYCEELINAFELLSSTEIWRDVVYEDVRRGRYRVSSFGRVMNKETGIIMKQFLARGYYILELATEKPNHGRSFKVHRLVATAFIPNILNKREVNHIDGDKTNNHVENLEWVTSSENQKHAFRLGLQKARHGEESGVSKFTNNEVSAMCESLIKNDGDLNKTLDEFKHISGLTTDILKSIKYKQNWCCVSDKYFDKSLFIKEVPDELIHFICKTLLSTEGNITETLKIVNEKYDYDVNYRMIQSIRSKRSYCSISDMYFSKEKYTQERSDYLSIDMVKIICKALIECNGDLDKTSELLTNMGYNIKRHIIINIRRGVHYKDISREFFEYSKGQLLIKDKC